MPFDVPGQARVFLSKASLAICLFTRSTTAGSARHARGHGGLAAARPWRRDQVYGCMASCSPI